HRISPQPSPEIANRCSLRSVWSSRTRIPQRLPAYLVGMGLIVYLGDFGPLSNPVFPLWWDMLAVAVFSPAIYYWARAVALPTERIGRMSGQVVVPEEEEPAPLRRAA